MTTRLLGAAFATALAAAALAPTATAQQTTAPGTTTARPAPVAEDRGFGDWGLLGLLGLAGLAPLFMRKDRQGNVHADTRR